MRSIRAALRTLLRLYGAPEQRHAAYSKVVSVLRSEGLMALVGYVRAKVARPYLRYNDQQFPLNAEEDVAAYRAWRARHENSGSPGEADPVSVLAVLLHAPDDARAEHTLRSLEEQTAQPARIVQVSKIQGIDQFLSSSQERWFMVLRAGDRLLPRALEDMVRLGRREGSLVVYADHDYAGNDGLPERPYFKPGFSPRLTFDQPDWLGPCLIDSDFGRKTLGRYRIEGPEELNALAALHATRVNRLPMISSRLASEQRYTLGDVLSGVLQAAPGSAEIVARSTEEPRIRLTSPSRLPSVSIVVPFRDRPKLLKDVLEGLERTDYSNKEVILVDNGSRRRETAQVLAAFGHRVVRDEEAFNFSRLVNRGAEAADGELLLFLNNDVQLLSHDWLLDLVREVVQPGVGAVGPMLMYRDGTVQHAGVVCGPSGHPWHAYKYYPADRSGYHGGLQNARECAAVTGACLLTPRAVFAGVKGFDLRLPLNFNDVHFCYKIRKAGYRVLFVPYSRLIHLESQTRPAYTSEEEITTFAQLTWGDKDEYYPDTFADSEPGYYLRNA